MNQTELTKFGEALALLEEKAPSTKASIINNIKLMFKTFNIDINIGDPKQTKSTDNLLTLSMPLSKQQSNKEIEAYNMAQNLVTSILNSFTPDQTIELLKYYQNDFEYIVKPGQAIQ